MSYISTGLSPNKQHVYVWERDEDGNRNLKKYNCEYYFYIQDDEGKYKDIIGNTVKRLNFNTYSSMRDSRDAYINKGVQVYESDIGMEYKILSNHYYGKKVNKLNFTLYDIEVDYIPEKGFAGPLNPYAPVSAVALYHEYSGRLVVYAVPSPKFKDITIDDVPDDIKANVELVLCKDEKELLLCFMDEIANTDLLSGWNSDYYDAPYIYERLAIVFNKSKANDLSLPGARKPYYKEVYNEKFGTTRSLLVTSGRISVDYMELFKKFEAQERSSYALESIADEVLPHLPKLSYDDSLHALYHEDFFHFLRYNVRDTEILKGFEDKLGYMEVAIGTAHMDGSNVLDVLGTIRSAGQAIVNFCHHNMNVIVPDSGIREPMEGKFTGALVLDPQVGMHPWTGATDIKSLYPNAIRSINASPDTIVGQFMENHLAYDAIRLRSSESLTMIYESGEMEEMSATEWRNKLLELNYSLSGYGTIYDLNRPGLIPQVLETWYNERIEFQNKKAEAAAIVSKLEKNGGSKKEIEKYKAIVGYAHRIQYIKKIKLNSLYGAIGNQFFRFFDLRIAESTTRTGRGILMHMVHKISELLDGNYTWPSESTIYSDTDSCYFKTHTDNVEDAYRVGTAIAHMVNKSFPEFMSDAFLCNDDFNKLMIAELEVISDNAIFVKKKHYMMHLVKLDGLDVDKMKIMGLPLKKTTVPKAIREVLIGYMEELLKGRDWGDISKDLVEYRHDIKDSRNIMDIGLPKGVNKVEEYTEAYLEDANTFLSGGAAASIFWNHCISHYDDLDSFPITSGMKIKVFYLTKKFGRFKSIAIPTDAREVPKWFTKHFEPLIDREAQALRLIENSIKTILFAIGEKMPTRKSLLFDELVEY